MKRLIAFTILLFFMTTNSCFAFSELYYFKNIKTTDVEPIVNNAFLNNDFKIIKQNPYYAISEINGERSIIIMQQSGDNMFYYYNADKNTKVNKYVLREMKRLGIIVEQSFNNNIISIYDDIADTLALNSGNSMQYTFEEENMPTAQNSKPDLNEPKMYSGYIAQIAAGTKFNIYLQNAINTATASQGDSVIGVVQDGINYNGNIVIPQGSLVYGTLTKARNATYGSMNGRVIINFNKIVTPDNYEYNISTEKVDFAVSNEDKVKESAKSAVTTAAAGAIIGLLFSLLTDSRHTGRSAAIGAGIGAGSAVIRSAAEKGVDAEIPSFTEMELTLTAPLIVNVSR